jgi:ribosomal protein S18 acetylase RimI-like enzyme
MLVRSATADDVPAILPMVRSICAMHAQMDPARYDFLPDIVDRYSKWLPARASDPRSVLLIGEDSAGAAGFLVGSVETNIPIYHTLEYGFIHDLWVEPRARRSGLASLLADAALQRFQAMGVSQVRLETAAGNDAARALFAHRGFRVATIDMLVQIR